MFKINDRVICLNEGEGTVTKIDASEKYPIRVKFDECLPHDYTADGHVYAYSKYPILFHIGKLKVIESLCE